MWEEREIYSEAFLKASLFSDIDGHQGGMEGWRDGGTEGLRDGWMEE